LGRFAFYAKEILKGLNIRVTYFLNATSKASWMLLLLKPWCACFVHISLNVKQPEATNKFSIPHLSIVKGGIKNSLI